MTITDTLFYRPILTPQQKWLLVVLKWKATSDGSLAISRYALEHDINLTGSDVGGDLCALVLSRDLDLKITKTSQGDLYEIQLVVSRQEVLL